MKTDGQNYLERLETSACTGFQKRFAKVCVRLELGSRLDGNELRLLYNAAFGATLCNIAFNGLGGCGGVIKPEREPHRLRLEREFMGARDMLRAVAGWQRLSEHLRVSIQRIFLNVFVAEGNLAG